MCMSDNCSWNFTALLCFIKCRGQFFKIMTIYVYHVPPKAPKLLVYRAHALYFAYLAINLKSVQINDCNQVVEFPMSRLHRSLPHDSLLKFSVTSERIHSTRIFINLTCDSHSYCSGKSLSERACRHLNPRNLAHIRVSLEFAAHLSERHHFVYFVKASLPECCIKRRNRMTLG